MRREHQRQVLRAVSGLPPGPGADETTWTERSEAFELTARDAQRAHWDHLATRWDPELREQGLNPHRLGLFSRRLRSPALLIGAGRGHVLRRLQEIVGHAVGVDWSPEMVARGRRDGTPHLREADAGALPFGECVFASAIVSTGVLRPTHGLRRLRGYLAEAARVVAPGGTVVTCLFYDEGNRSAREQAARVRVPLDTVECDLFWDLSIVRALLAETDQRVHDVSIDGDVAAIVATKVPPPGPAADPIDHRPPHRRLRHPPTGDPPP